MLGMAWLTTSILIAMIGGVYIMDYFGVLRKIPFANLLSGHVPKSLLFLGIGGVMVVGGLGIVTFGGIADTVNALPSQSTTDTYGADINLITAGTAGAAFADSGYNMYLLDYETYSGSSANAILQDVIDSGTGGLISTEGTTATPDTVTSGLFTWQDQVAKVGDKFVVWGYDDKTPAAGDYEAFFGIIEIVGFNADQGTFTVTPNRYQLYTYGTVDTYNYAKTDVAGYVEDEDTSTPNMGIEFKIYSNADYNISKDAGLYMEVSSAMQTQINSIMITTDTIDGGLFAEYSSFLDTSNLGMGSKIFESAPSKQTAGNSMYFVGALPDALRTSSTSKEAIGVEVDYDHLGTGSQLVYFYVVENMNGGVDQHFDINANPAFTLNATADGTDAWTT